jgi:anthranilate synthase/aminodeoxychorismate synthase-like glutamine amidotransferase
MKVVIIDCFDSFTYNLLQLVGTAGANPIAITSDQSIEKIEQEQPDRIILSPGPGTPDESGVCREVIGRYAGIVPILGVCLGHQTIVQTFGGKIVRLETPVHGKTSQITHTGTGIFDGVSPSFTATRYHSLTADTESLPESIRVTATSQNDGCIMAVSHTTLPIHGVQFHPESIMTPAGYQIIKNFLKNGGM